MSRSVSRRPRDLWADRFPRRLPTLAALAAVAVAVAGCSSILSEMPQQMGGLPSDAPARPAVPPSYPAVNDMPEARAERTLTETERKKVQADLDAARAAAAKRAGTAAQTQER